MEDRKKAVLADYFPAVERRMARSVPAFYDMDALLGRYILRFHFESSEQRTFAGALYTGLSLPAGERAADAEFFFWSDDLKGYFPDYSREGGVWSLRDETGFLKLVSSCGMTGGDFARGRYYSCLEKETGKAEPPRLQDTLGLMFRWALESGMFLLHGAAVGKSGKGVLLGGMGGAGKSTLALSCLQMGMDFTGDDYVLMSRRGPHLVMPFFHTVKLCPDMEQKLRPGFPLLLEEAGGKKLLDASEQPFCPALPLSCIVLPELSFKGTPRIGPVPPGQAAARMVRSAMIQFGFEREFPLIREMTLRLGALPVYEMSLSGDPADNALCLETFIKDRL